MAVDSLAKASTPEPLGTKNLWNTSGLNLPAYVQHIARDLMEKRGMTKSRAIATAIAAVKRWAVGGGNVDAGTRAAARKALAEWEAAKTRAHATPNKGSTKTAHLTGRALALAWDPAKHPRGKAGSHGGGKFVAVMHRVAATLDSDRHGLGKRRQLVQSLPDEHLHHLHRLYKTTPPPVTSRHGHRAAHSSGTTLALASPMVTSGDGPAVTVNAYTKGGKRMRYTAQQRRDMAKKGHALADGSFPIGDKADLVKAAKAVGRAHPSKRAAVKAHVRKRAKALGVSLPGAGK